MASFILLLNSPMQDWPAEQGSIDLCAASEYPLKKDLIKNILIFARIYHFLKKFKYIFVELL